MDILLFGAVAEKAGASILHLEATSVEALRQALIARIPDLAHMRYAIAVDRQVAHDDRSLHGGEEIAVLPPFAGG